MIDYIPTIVLMLIALGLIATGNLPEAWVVIALQFVDIRIKIENNK